MMTMWKLSRVVVSLAFFAILLCGCGGGTTGTENTRLSGSVVDRTGEVLPDIVVTDEVSGDDDDTDDGGQFTIASTIVDGVIQVTLSGQGFDVTVSIYDVPEETKVVNVVFTVDRSDPSNVLVSITDITFE